MNIFVTGLLVILCFTFRFAQPLHDDFNIRYSNGTNQVLDKLANTFENFPLLEKIIQPYVGSNLTDTDDIPTSHPQSVREMAVKTIASGFRQKLQAIDQLNIALQSSSENELHNALKVIGINLNGTNTNSKLKEYAMNKIISHFAATLPANFDYFPSENSDILFEPENVTTIV